MDLRGQSELQGRQQGRSGDGCFVSDFQVPLVTTHDVRAVLLDAADGSGEIDSSVLQEDLPVLAATVK